MFWFNDFNVFIYVNCNDYIIIFFVLFIYLDGRNDDIVCIFGCIDFKIFF